MFSLLPKRQQALQHKTYSVAARSVKEPGEPLVKKVEPLAKVVFPTDPAQPGRSAVSADIPLPLPSIARPMTPPTPTTQSGAPAVALPAKAPASAWLHQFPAVGHFACPCGLPICTAAAKARSLGGFPTFCRYFGPSLQLQLTLPTGGAFGSIASFTASCSRCGVELGYIPLTTTVLTTTSGNDQSDEGVHALRVTRADLKYLGQKAPPEYLSMEVAALASVDDAADGPGNEGARRAVSGRGLRGLLTTAQHSPIKATRRDDSTSDEEESDEENDEEEDDDDLWLAMRNNAKRT
jgi:hypothetical protein